MVGSLVIATGGNHYVDGVFLYDSMDFWQGYSRTSARIKSLMAVSQTLFSPMVFLGSADQTATSIERTVPEQLCPVGRLNKEAMFLNEGHLESPTKGI